MEKGLQEYQAAFPEVGVTAESVPGYSRAKSKLDEYLPFENSLVRVCPCVCECVHQSSLPLRACVRVSTRSVMSVFVLYRRVTKFSFLLHCIY